VKGALRLAACDARAASLGLKPGLALADARAMQPSLAIADADPGADLALLRGIADWCGRWTPLLALDPPDGIILDISGATHLFGGERSLRDEIEKRLSAQGFAARAAIAATPEMGWAAARFSNQLLIQAGQEENALRPLPLEALRAGPDVASALRRVGLRRVGDIMSRPRAPIAARFGQPLLDRLDAALGRIRSPIAARVETAPYIAEKRFFDPVVTPMEIERTLLKLACDLSTLLAAHDEGAQRIEALFFRVDGHVRRIVVGASRPLREPHAMVRLLREKLSHSGDEIDIGYGFDVVRLSALEVEKRPQGQVDFADDQNGADVAQLIDTLSARLGAQNVTCLQPIDSHWPESAATIRPAVEKRDRRAAASWRIAMASPEAPERPIRLFDRPEPVEAIAAVPDGPPIRFRWRRVLHEVAHVEGPERIAAEWWKAAGPARDYFRAEDSRGRRFWLFREGLYDDGTEPPRWFMHGLFA